MKFCFSILLLFLTISLCGQDKLEVYQEGFKRKTALRIMLNGVLSNLQTRDHLIFSRELTITKPAYGQIIFKSGKYAGFYIEPEATKVVIKKKGFPASLEVPNSESHKIYQALHHAKNGKAFMDAALKFQDNPIAQEQLNTGFKFKKLTIEQLNSLYSQLRPDNKLKVPLLTAFLNTYKKEKITPGSVMYDFIAEDRNSNIYSTKEYRGQYLLIDFASTGCGPCWAGYPDMIAVTSDYDKLQVLTYNEDFDTEGWKSIALKRGIRLEWPVLWYGKDKAEVFELYNVEGWPLLFLIGPDGIVLDAWYGSTKERLNSALKKHLK